MRKISKSRPSNLDGGSLGTDLRSTRPLRIPGATITSWSGSLDIDLDRLFARPQLGASVAGANSPESTNDKRPGDDKRLGDDKRAGVDRPTGGTVSLSDGTRITFATAGPFDIVELV
jgi:hypothetical protein